MQTKKHRMCDILHAAILVTKKRQKFLIFFNTKNVNFSLKILRRTAHIKEAGK